MNYHELKTIMLPISIQFFRGSVSTERKGKALKKNCEKAYPPCPELQLQRTRLITNSSSKNSPKAPNICLDQNLTYRELLQLFKLDSTFIQNLKVTSEIYPFGLLYHKME